MAVLISSDTVPHYVDRHVATMMGKLLEITDDLEQLVTNVEIKSLLLKQIINFCEHNQNRIYSMDIDTWNDEFFGGDIDFIKQCLDISIYLGIKELEFISAQAIGKQLRSQSLEQMRRIMGLDS